MNEDARLPGASEVWGGLPHGPPSVLLCGMDGIALLHLERALKHAGISAVYHAATAEAALKCAERSRPDVVLTEMRLPDLSGQELARRLLRMYPACTFVIYDHLDEESEERCIEGGACGVIEKPYRADEVVRMIRRSVPRCS